MIRNKPLKISIAIFLFAFFVFFFFPSNIYSQEISVPGIIAESAIAIETTSGEILWEKNAEKRMYPASTTKMLTAIIAIEQVTDYNELVEISENATGRNHSAFWFEEGDTISLKDLLKAALICSHNNATIALAEHISGSEEKFVELMNKKAKKIGAESTYFQNTNGLDANYPYHKTTAKDLAIIAKYCMENEMFRNIVNTKEDIIKINDKEVEIKSTNKLLPYYFVKGIKTGLTNNAGFCLVTYSDKNGIEIISVILNSDYMEREQDALNLINYISENYGYEKIVDEGEVAKEISVGEINTVGIGLYTSASYTDLINANKDKIVYEYEVNEGIDLPIPAGEELGKMGIYINDSKVEEIPLISGYSVNRPYMEQKITDKKEEKTEKILIFILSFYFFLFAFIIVKNFFFRKRYYL
ncbi:MAG: D-alanyl-D-alanine carboxypeptidase family protein [Actinomycetota bacterium]